MKILFIRFSSIGDIVLTTPVVRCVKEQISDCEIHFLLKRAYAPVLNNNPHISKLHYYDNNISATAETLKEENFDLVVDLQKNLRSFRLKQLLGIKSFTFDKLNIKKWLLVNFRIDKLPRIHIVDRYMKSVASLGVVNDGRGLDYFLDPKDKEALDRLPQIFGDGYIAWVIGARHFTKRLPEEKMSAIAGRINKPVVLLGDENDAAAGSRIASMGGDKFYNGCGKFSLNESAAIVKHAERVITHDTGLMHIAAAFQKKIISVWGNTIPEFGMYPYFGERNISRNETGSKGQDISWPPQNKGSKILQVNNLSCRPCSKIGFEKCPKGHFRCMREIDESIFDEA